MSDVKVFFLGEEYTVPSELRQYVQYSNFFDRIHSDLINLLTIQIKKKTYTSGAEIDFSYYSDPMKTAGDCVIASLAKDRIYDATLNELVYLNPGYIQLKKTCSDTLLEMGNILLTATQEWIDGYNNARSSALSNVTGSGVGIITNSLVPTLLYSAMEAHTVKKQLTQAENEYHAAITSLNRRNTEGIERKNISVLVNKYYPGVSRSIKLFVSNLMEQYLVKLERNGIFNYSIIKQYDLARSTELLQNLQIIADNRHTNNTQTDSIQRLLQNLQIIADLKGIIIQSFLYCPYNPNIYKAVFASGLGDFQTFQTAKYFMLDDILLGIIDEYCKEHLSNPAAITDYVDTLADCSSQEERTVWADLYKVDISKIMDKFSNYQGAILDNRKLAQWLENNITTSPIELCSFSDDQLLEAIEQIILYDNDSKTDFFVNKGIIRLSEIKPDYISVSDIAELKPLYSKLIFEKSKNYIPLLHSHIIDYEKKANCAKVEYEQVLDEHQSKIAQLKDELRQLVDRKNQLGFFAFAKKKDIELRIENKQHEIYKCSSMSLVNSKREIYEDILNAADSYV